MALMKVVVASNYGLLKLQTIEIPIPSPSSNEVLIRVCAAALNHADYKVVLGEFKFFNRLNYPLVLGYDFSGKIEKTGSDVNNFRVGDEVFGFIPYNPIKRQGSFGEYVLAKASEIALKPLTVTHFQAAAVATTGSTAFQGMKLTGQLAPKKNILITGASGSVGSIAHWIANKIGAHVTVVGSGAGLEQARMLGAKNVIDYKIDNVFSSEFGLYDLVFDAAAAYQWSQWSSLLSNQGTYLTTLPSLNFFLNKIKALFSKKNNELVLVKPIKADFQQLGEWLSSGLAIPIDSVISPNDIDNGLERLIKGQVVGKIVVDIEKGFNITSQ